MGLVDSLFGKDARKFLKRKDSDAAEAGESLIIIIFHFLFAFFLFYIFSEIQRLKKWCFILLTLNDLRI